MHFVPVVSAAAVFVAAVQGAAFPPSLKQGVQSQIKKIEEEINQLENKLAHGLAGLDWNRHHLQGSATPSQYQPSESSTTSRTSTSSSSADDSSAPASTTSSIFVDSATQSILSSAASLKASSLASSYLAGITSSITLPSASSVASANASSVLASLSSVRASLSSAVSSVSSVNATVTNTLATGHSASATSSTTTVKRTSTVSSTATVSAVSASGNSSSVLSTGATSTLSTSSLVSAGFANSTSVFSIASASSAASRSPVPSGNATSAFLTAPASSAFLTSTKIVTANSSSTSIAGTATSTMAPVTTLSSCAAMCSSVKFSSSNTVTPYVCQAYKAGDTVTITGGQATSGCATSYVTPLDICRVTLEVTTSFASKTYVEAWLPDSNTTSWNGRTMSTGNGGLNGCVPYTDMVYAISKGFAAFGDNAGHNATAFDGSLFYNNNELVLDWADRGRHEAVLAGKDIVKAFYGQAQGKAYYIGCSAGGAQGLHSAQYHPEDFDGIVAGSAAADFEHLQDWSSRFIQLTGLNSTDPRFLTKAQWVLVQSYIFAQCDAAIDGVNDGILEDPTQCQFDASQIAVCNSTVTTDCLTSTQVSTVWEIFKELYDADGNLLYPALLYGSQVDAFSLGQLSGSVQGIVHDWFAYAVYNNSAFDALTISQTDYTKSDSLDAYHGYPSDWKGDISAFKARGSKMIMYHGMADPLVSGASSQRYYLKVAKTLGLTNTGMDDFLRLFRISGMAHCGVGGISGAGAWMFGQTAASAVSGIADNVVDDLVAWVEKGTAPNVLTGTKFFYDTPSLGVQYVRPHCRFPYRTTYNGVGDYWLASSWGCTFISDWQTCAVGAHPRLCNADGSFV